MWVVVACECTQGCPLLLDTEADGFKLTSREDGVHFDLNSDGTAELISWTEAGSDDGWLVLDRNGNGKIDKEWSLTIDSRFMEGRRGHRAASSVCSVATYGL